LITLNNQPPPRPTTEKTLSAGTILWEKTLTGLEECQINVVYPVTGLGCLVAGSTSARGSGKKAWIAALNIDGTVIWELVYGKAQYIN
jgi:hypothetical protein